MIINMLNLKHILCFLNLKTMEQTKGLLIAAVRQEETKTCAKTASLALSQSLQISFHLTKIWDIRKK